MNKKILVVDDMEINRQSASLLSDKGYQVNTASDFSEGVEILGVNPFTSPEEGFKSDYFAVLTDLMMPIGGHGKRSPCNSGLDNITTAGYPLALFASRIEVPNIAILTSMNHHDSPDAAVFDMFHSYSEAKDEEGYTRRSRPLFNLNGSRFMMFDDDDIKSLCLRKDGSFGSDYYDLSEEKRDNKYVTEIERGNYGSYRNPVHAKNWVSVLEILLDDSNLKHVRQPVAE